MTEGLNVIANAMGIFAGIFLALILLGLLCILFMYIIDRSQTKHAIRHNYPVVGRFRYMFEHLGGFFRQYFFALDREEMPFNRAERSWAYRAAKNLDTTVAFGSTRNLNIPGTVLFTNSSYPTLEEEAATPQAVIIGEGCRMPYRATSFYNISGMSFGAISKPAVLALSKGARMARCWMNTGEGGLSPYHLEGGADLVFQVGTAKYGVRTPDGKLNEDKLRELALNDRIKMFEIKMSQGAKPGKGGILPAAKVTKEVAEIRGITIAQDSISPNRHPEVDDPDSLIDLINHIRQISGKPVGIKAVLSSAQELDELFTVIAKRGVACAPDFIALDSADGGSGAAPQSLIDYMGLPLKESLPMLVDKLQEYHLRERVKVVAAGKLITPSGVAWALSIGADFVTSARGFMFALGCIQAMQCNKNTCPTGITTHDKRLQRGLDPMDKSERVKHYALNMMHEVEMIAHSCGVKEPRLLRRCHARIVGDNGLSIPLNKLYPEVKTIN
ncbi:MAG: FMN-binding glutamate synthase family protein [Pseudomonadales bacterium]|nr:FMN-binding glutamate synthase family protein [Pseudomonadales bacterium]